MEEIMGMDFKEKMIGLRLNSLHVDGSWEFTVIINASYCGEYRGTGLLRSEAFYG
jgi:hypothetical protein